MCEGTYIKELQRVTSRMQKSKERNREQDNCCSVKEYTGENLFD